MVVDGGDGVVAASRFTPVHLELRKGYDEYIGDYIGANWEGGGGGIIFRRLPPPYPIAPRSKILRKAKDTLTLDH